MVNPKLKRFLFRFYLPIVVVLFLFVFLWFFLITSRNSDDISLLITFSGGLISFFYFVQKQQLEELEVFKDLFNSFNDRYNALNERLNDIRSKNGEEELKYCERTTLYDYFNLCGEENLYYSQGYIYPEVRRAWCNGMADHLKNPRILDLWKEEEKTDSYYGLTLDLVKKYAAKPKRR